MKTIALIFSMACFHFLFAQQKSHNELEALKKKIRQSTYYDSVAVFENGAKAIKLAESLGSKNEVGIIYQYYGNFYYFSRDDKRAKQYYYKSIDIARKTHDENLENSTEIRLAFLLSEGDVLAAEKEFNRLLVIAKSNGFIKNIVECYNGLGIIYEMRNILDEAMKYYIKALKVAEKNDLTYHRAIILNNIGLIKFKNNQKSEARTDFTKALELAYEVEESRLAINLHSNLGLVNNELKNYSEAISHYKETLKNAKKLGFPTAMSVSFINLGNAYFKNNQSEEALKYADSAIYLFSKYNDDIFLGQAYLLKATIFNKLKNNVLAKVAVDSALEIHKRAPDLNNYATAFEVLSLISESEGNYQEALIHFKKYSELEDSLSEMSNKDKLGELQVVYGKERVEAELEQEKSKNNLLVKENQLKKERIRTLLISSLFILLLGLGITYVRYVFITRKQQVIFSQKLIKKIDEERSRISKDLHDDIGQSLSVVKSKINMYNTGRITAIDGLETDLGDLIVQTRKISHELHPSFLEKIGLIRSLTSLIDKTQESTNIICSIDLAPEVESISTESKTQIYRIVQECINNTIKHSGATALKVSISYYDGDFELKYKDNGQGMIQTNGAVDGIGILTIKERVKKMNGKSIFTPSSVGFRLIIKFKSIEK